MTKPKKIFCGGTEEATQIKLWEIELKIKELAKQSGKEKQLKQLEKKYNKILQNDLVFGSDKYITWREIKNNPQSFKTL